MREGRRDVGREGRSDGGEWREGGKERRREGGKWSGMAWVHNREPKRSRGNSKLNLSRPTHTYL